MYKISTIEDTVRIPPKRFGENVEEVIVSELDNTITGRVNKEIGIILAPIEVNEVGEGKIILGDGAAYYDTSFKALTYMPMLHEVVEGEVTEITEFGAFVSVGPIEGLIHVSQLTEDFMSYDDKNNMFTGRESNKSLKVGDKVRARIVTVSLKDRVSDSKIGLTMRQPYLGKLEWLAEEKEKKAKDEKAKDEKGKEKEPKGKEKKKEGKK
ncbi:MAG: DNA-directed RNA polymerase [Candidatus Altiarchaeota archaeon]